jgi:hypothetical protein
MDFGTQHNGPVALRESFWRGEKIRQKLGDYG